MRSAASTRSGTNRSTRRGSDPVGGTADRDGALHGAVHAEDRRGDGAGTRLTLAVRLRHAGPEDLLRDGPATGWGRRSVRGVRRVESAGQDLLLLGRRQEGQDAGARAARVEREAAPDLDRHLDLLLTLHLVEVHPSTGDERRHGRRLAGDLLQLPQYRHRKRAQVGLAQRPRAQGGGGRPQVVLARAEIRGQQPPVDERLQNAVDDRLGESQLASQRRHPEAAGPLQERKEHVSHPCGRFGTELLCHPHLVCSHPGRHRRDV